MVAPVDEGHFEAVRQFAINAVAQAHHSRTKRD